MLRLSPVLRFIVFCCALLGLAACAVTPVATLGGSEPALPPTSPLPTPNPNLAVYEIPIRSDANEQGLQGVARLEFDTNRWQFNQSHLFNYVLRNLENPNCILLQPASDPAEPNPPVERTVQLGEHTWTVHVDEWLTDGGIWQLRYRSAPYEFPLILLNYVEPVTETAGRACIIAMEGVLATFTLAPSADERTPPTTVRPRVWLKSQEDAMGEPIVLDPDTALADSAAWPQHDSERIGITFRYPPAWYVNESDFPETYLAPPTEDISQRIWLAWRATEIRSDQSLREWVEEFEGHELMLPFETVIDETLPIVDPSGTSEQVRLDYYDNFVGGAYLISHGNLILQISTDSAWVDAPALLRTVASSIEFHADAPQTLEERP